MPIYALRRTVGSFSAGTRVTLIENLSDKKLAVVEPDCVQPDSDNYLEVEWSDLVKLRNHIDTISTTSRKQRREFLKGLFKGTKET